MTFDQFPDEVLVHRIQLLSERANQALSEIWRIRQELRERKVADPAVRTFLDEKQMRDMVRCRVGPLV